MSRVDRSLFIDQIHQTKGNSGNKLPATVSKISSVECENAQKLISTVAFYLVSLIFGINSPLLPLSPSLNRGSLRLIIAPIGSSRCCRHHIAIGVISFIGVDADLMRRLRDPARPYWGQSAPKKWPWSHPKLGRSASSDAADDHAALFKGWKSRANTRRSRRRRDFIVCFRLSKIAESCIIVCRAAWSWASELWMWSRTFLWSALSSIGSYRKLHFPLL